MTTYFKTLLLMTAVIGLSVPAIAKADFRDYNHKAWNQQFNRYKQSSRTVMRSRSYRATAPVIVRSEGAPQAVAQAPTERRSFSYEPSQQGTAASPCPDRVTTTQPAPATATA